MNEDIFRKPPPGADVELTKSGGGRPILHCLVSELRPHPSNARKHSKAQIRAIAKSITAFGFNAPILADKDLQVLAGHGRCEGAKLLGMTHVSEFANDRFSSIEELASKAEVHPKIMRQALKLAFLAPDIVTSILAGGARFELADLRNVSALSWQSQRDELHQARSPLRSD